MALEARQDCLNNRLMEREGDEKKFKPRRKKIGDTRRTFFNVEHIPERRASTERVLLAWRTRNDGG